MFRIHHIVTLTVTGAALTSALAAVPRSPTVPKKSAPRDNPLLSPSTLPFHAPAFDKIKNSDFAPAFDEGMKQALAEAQKIADNSAAPTFDNTLVALEKGGQLLSRVNMVFNALAGANTNDTIQKLQEEVAPKLAATRDAIYLNPKLFNRIETLYNQRNKLKLDAESARLLDYQYQEFVLAGAKLSEADKAKLKKLNGEDASLNAKFTNQLLNAAKAGALITKNKADLAGLGPAEIQAAAQAAKERGLKDQWVLPLRNTTQQPALGSLTNRSTREKLFEASWNHAEHGDKNDTRETIARLAQIRGEQAKLLGFPNFAAWKLQDQMAKTPGAVMQLLDRLGPAATGRAKKEAAEIQARINAQKAGFKLQPWDWDLYGEQVRKAKYDLEESEVKPYFELNRVLNDGVFYAANQLFGITFKERKDIPVYHPDVRVFEVTDEDGKALALFYCDYFKRDNKNGGAWMDNLVIQSKLMGTLPVIYNVGNFQKPQAGEPALLSPDDAVTMFHEFGHALHGIFANQQYPSLSGTSVARDYVEFPSQANEHWVFDPKVLQHYAVHYKTGKPIPKPLLDKILNARHFNAGYAMTELVAAAKLDMSWHSLPAGSPLQKVDEFEKSALAQGHVNMAEVPPRYRSSYFMHIWGNGYAAGYYAYIWTQMLADDSGEWFDKHGGMTRANGDRYREMVLSKGNTEEYGKMYRDFAGHDPQIEPMLKNRGLTDY